MRKLMIFLSVGALLVPLTGAAMAAKGKAKIEMVMFTDDEGDADMGQGLGGSIPAGFDLVEGKIKKVKKDLEFTVTHADMPPSGSFPEGFRFLWAFNVDGDNYRLSIKSVDIGKPDVLAGQTTDRLGRVDVQGQFRLEGECVSESLVALNAVNCPPLAYLDGAFDPATMSFTAIVPLKEIKAKPGSIVGPGGGENSGICPICWVSHTVERSLNSTIVDMAASIEEYKVPKKG